MYPAAYGIALAVLVSWFVSAAVLDQSLLATQRSRDLMTIGAADGALFTTHEWWRLITSQYLHVHFLHMLFNVACIAIVGAAVEQAFRWQGLLIVYVGGGTAGQFASVMALPQLVSSGASQALMALCAAALLISRPRIRFVALAIIAVQVALDLYVSGAIKIGHSIGFLAGLVITLGVLWVARRRKPN